MEYLNHHVRFEMRPAFSKLLIIFLAVKLKLEHNFSQFFCRFEIGTLNLGLSKLLTIDKEI